MNDLSEPFISTFKISVLHFWCSVHKKDVTSINTLPKLRDLSYKVATVGSFKGIYDCFELWTFSGETMETYPVASAKSSAVFLITLINKRTNPKYLTVL